ncbi:hypothetical protein VTO42DRAFT_3459 [Malbranchea cinnamomea]
MEGKRATRRNNGQLKNEKEGKRKDELTRQGNPGGKGGSVFSGNTLGDLNLGSGPDSVTWHPKPSLRGSTPAVNKNHSHHRQTERLATGRGSKTTPTGARLAVVNLALQPALKLRVGFSFQRVHRH